MFFVSASELTTSDIAQLGNNIRPPRRRDRSSPDDRCNQRVLAAVNRSLSPLEEQVDQLYPMPSELDAWGKLAS